MGNPLGEQIYGQDSGQSSVDNGQQGMQYGDQGQGYGYNPNFQPLLKEIPQDLHSKILPHLQEWDKGYNRLQSEYAPYKPLLATGATPEMLQNGLNLMNLLETNPEGLYEALAKQYGPQDTGAGAGQGQQTPPIQQATTQQQVPEYATQLQSQYGQMEQNFTTLAQHVLAMRKQEEDTRQDALVAQEFENAHKRVGAFDDQWVRAHCIADPKLTIEQAGKMYQDWERGVLARHGARPIITGSSGGGVPGADVDVTKLSGQQARSLGADMLRAARQQAS